MFNETTSYERTGAARGGSMAAKVYDLADLTERRTITTAEAADALGISERSVRQWCEDGKLPARHVGKSWRINVRVLRERHPDLWEEMLDAREERAIREAAGLDVLGPTGSLG